MKFIGKLLLSLLLLILLAVVVLYVLLQTSWAAGWISQWVNQNSQYRLSLGKIEHSWTQPAHIQLNDVTLSRPDQSVILVAQQINAGLSVRQITEPHHFASLELRGGTLNLSDESLALPIEADILQLRTMAVQAQDGDLSINSQQVNGGITPWQPEPGYLMGRQGRFQLSARSLRLNDIPASQVLVQGEINNHQLNLSNFGADVAQGQLTGNAGRAEDGSWRINSLRLSNVRLQTGKTLEEFLQPAIHLPSVAISRFDLIDARLEGKEWAFNDLDITLQNVTLQQNDWQSEDGVLSFNASDMVNGRMHLIDPIVNLALSPAGVTIKQFSTRWEGGLLRTNGSWQRNSRHLTLNELVVAGMEYTLPIDWRERWQKTLPTWLTGISVTKFNASRNLLIDINPDFPFQITALDGYGSNLLLARDRQWGIWGGTLTLNGSDATFNKVDIRRPSLALSADDRQIALSDLSAFAKEGLLEAKVNIDQLPARNFTLDLTGRTVPADILTRWGWPATLPEQNSNLQLRIAGQLSINTTLKNSVQGTLDGAVTDGQNIHQRIQQGTVSEAAQ
ncbi:AsmA family protein [Affinibrenneria salicis]|uniref:AsmA family protein n=1 Tax=Affinibrenneria salicis TaxID=2590031 RepID=A0A5J5FX11_9GAMM|nr:AsmA family protein [Affinibrenneria salicis]KAA8997411.1 AsmA family protein [Affinibrenneria salicis]